MGEAKQKAEALRRLQENQKVIDEGMKELLTAKQDWRETAKGDVLIFRLTDVGWRWRRRAANGEIVGASTEAYVNFADCRNNCDRQFVNCGWTVEIAPVLLQGQPQASFLEGAAPENHDTHLQAHLQAEERVVEAGGAESGEAE